MVTYDFLTFAVDDRPGLRLIAYNPVTPHDAILLRHLIEAGATAAGGAQ